jgi:signal transduction histidine kinase
MNERLGTAPDELADALTDYLAASGVLAVAHVGDDGSIVSANATLERLAGRPLAGRPLRELVTPEQQPALDRMLASDERGWSRTTLGLVPDHRGIPLDFAVSCRPMENCRLLIAEPLPSAVTAVDERVLELNAELADAQRRINRQNAELARHNTSLRELDRLKDALLANVSHDLRTPLTAILGYGELLRRRGGLSDDQAHGVDVIERNARRLLRLVNDLLLLAQTRAGALTIERETVDLSQLAADAVELLQPLADHAGIDLALRVAPSGPVIDGDPLRLGQLLENLIANAIKFSPAGSTVTVSAHDRTGSATLEVHDTGPGMPEGQAERLFDAFARGSPSQAPGAGLGLTIVKAIADAHDATIDIRTRPGHGTRFIVTFAVAG